MADALKYLNDDNFQTEIAQGVTLVDFFADWCGPCRMMEPIIHELAEELNGQVKIAKLDIEYREPLLLQLIGGFSGDEIAELLELNRNTVMTRLFRARNQLKELLEKTEVRGQSNG